MRRKNAMQGASTRSSLVAPLLAAVLVTATLGGLAQPGDSWSQQAKLTASDGDPGARLGWRVAVDGDTALVSAINDDNANGDEAGAAYVFTRDAAGTWVQEAKLTASDGDPGDEFGVQVDLVGDTALVGAIRDDDKAANAGAAYVFQRNANGNWNEQAKLTASDGGQGDKLGYSVSLDGDTAVVGATGNSDAGDPGAAYVFARNGGSWSEQAKLTASDGGPGDRFGFSVRLDGDTGLVGSRFDNNTNGADAGAAYVFTYDGNTWSEQAKLTASDGAAGDEFGASLSLDGDTAIAGARFHDTSGGQDAGAAYVFDRDSGGSWSQTAKLTADDSPAGDRLGTGVSLEGDRALVGAPFDEGHAGSAYVFTRSDAGSWSQQAKLTADDRESGDNLGGSVSLDGDRALLGARDEDTVHGEDAGAAYVFTNRTTEEEVQDETQNDAGTGGDASDDPEDPTPLPGGDLIHVNGTLVLGSDEVDAYGTNISEDTTRSMRFNFTIPAGMPLNLTLVSPNGSLADRDSTTVAGGQAIVEAPTQPDGFLEAGEWVTVLAIEPAGLGPSASGVGGPAAAGPEVSLAEDGLVPGVVPDRLTVVDYRDERPCDPHC